MSPAYTTLLMAISDIHEPKNFEEAYSQEIWRKFMDEELKALSKTNTWSIVPLPAGKHVIDCRWVYKLKFNPDGTIERPISRVVARGLLKNSALTTRKRLHPLLR